MNLIYDNIIFSLQKAGGISLYWSELLVRSKNVICYENNQNNIFRKNLTLNPLLESKMNLSVLRYLPFLKRIQSRSIFHSSYYRYSLQKNVLNITTVHDFTYEYFRIGLRQKIHTWQKRTAIHRSSGIICVSENTKTDLLKFFPKIDEKKIRVIYNGVGDEYCPIENVDKQFHDHFPELELEKYILFVGDRSDYKNFSIAVDVVAKFNNKYTLVIIGGGVISNSEINHLVKRKIPYIHLIGKTNAELNILYNGAFCLLYPSSYEGFGIPILEAMKAKCPVVSTRCSSIPEVAGDSALLVEQIHVDEFVSEIIKLEDENFRSQIREQGLKQVKKFSWDKCFAETQAFYQDVWNENFK